MFGPSLLLFRRTLPGTRSHRGGRPRHTGRGRFAVEALEERLIPTTLLPGFVETPVVSGLSAPTAMEFAPDGRLFVLEQSGNVKLVHNDGTTWTALHLNVDSSGERGLLGIAFDPDFSSNHFVYLYYTNPNPGGGVLGHRRAQPAQPIHRQRLQPPAADLHQRSPDPRLEQPERGHQPQRRRDPLRHGRHALRRRRRQRADLHAGGQDLPGLADPLQPAGQATPHRRLHVQQRRRDARRHHGRASDPGRQPVRGDGHRHQPAHLRARPAQPVHVRGPARHRDDLHQRRGRDHLGGDRPERRRRQLRLERRQHRRLRPVSRPVPARTTTRCSPTTIRAARPAAASPSSVAPSTTRRRRNSPASYVGKYFYEDLVGGWIREFDPAHPGSAANPDTSTAFASATPGGLRDIQVDSAGNLYYLSGDGAINKISYQAPQITTQPASQTVTQGQARRSRSPRPGRHWPTSGSTWSAPHGLTWAPTRPA